MFDFLYEDIGGKIKRMAKWTFIIEAIASIITGIVLAIDEYEGGYLLICIFGPIVAWVSSWILYAFGELVEDVHAIRNKECLAEQKTPSITIPKQKVNLYTSTNLNKMAKAFSVLAGIFFVMFALLSFLSFLFGGYTYITLLNSFSFILLGAFLFKQSKKGIVISWASLTVVTILSFFFTSIIMCLITIANYLLFMLLTVFQKKLFRNKIVQFAVFLLPLEYGFFSFVYNLDSFLGLLGIGIKLLGLVFFLLYLISVNSVEKTTLPEESQTDI